ncbi:MAG: glycerate kinase [Planctomycetota bacterium]
MNVLLCPNAFKGTITASEAASIMAEVISEASSTANPLQFPVSDGGDGFIECLTNRIPAVQRIITVSNPLGHEIQVPVLVAGNRWFIESATMCGFRAVSGLHPKSASSKGLGEAIVTALKNGARSIVIGVGGSISIDLGLGMAWALGARFYDKAGRSFEPRGAKDLSRIAEVRIDKIDSRISSTEFVAACDVTTSLTGHDGGLAIFSPQKGASPDLIEEILKEGERLSALFAAKTGRCSHLEAGTGAAGGIGAALGWFCNAGLCSGFDYWSHLVNFEKLLASADVVVTGEGRLDETSLRGKATGRILLQCIDLGKPLTIICGNLTTDVPYASVFTMKADGAEQSGSLTAVRSLFARTCNKAFRAFLR